MSFDATMLNNTFTPDPDWVSGDMTLVSSDRVLFKVSSRLLAYASSVFADMLAIPMQGNSAEHMIELADPDFEDAQTIRTFLTLFATGDVDIDLDAYNLGFTGPHYVWKTRVLKLVTFLDKYGSDTGLNLLRTTGGQAYASGRFGLSSPEREQRALVFGALTGNLDLCVKAVATYPEDSEDSGWMDSTDEEGALGSRDGEMFEVTTMPYTYLCCLPPQFQFALIRAFSSGYHQGSMGFTTAFCEALKAALEAEDSRYHPVPASLPSLRNACSNLYSQAWKGYR